MPTILLEILGRAEKYWMGFGGLYVSINLHLKYVVISVMKKAQHAGLSAKKKGGWKEIEKGFEPPQSPILLPITLILKSGYGSG